MKILSIRQPWAWLIVAGHKDIENRKWYTNHRGPLLIHASKAMDPEDFPMQRKWVNQSGIVIPEDLPRGAIVGAATLTDVWDKKKFERPGIRWFEGPYGFKMEDAVEFAEPIPWRGQLGIREASDANLMGDLFETLEDGIRFNEYLLTK